MRFHLLILCVSIISAVIHAGQYNNTVISATFSLLSGSKTTISEHAKYSIAIGIFDAQTSPGGRQGHTIASYNGLIYVFHGLPLAINDVFAFNPTDKTWAWMAGRSNSASASYGLRGIPNNQNSPGQRSEFGGDVHAARGEYILFGGFVPAGKVGDTWSFSFVSSGWTWLAGSSVANESPYYGSLGVSTTTTRPGSRGGLACAVVPSTGELLVFAGLSGSANYLADTWSFNFTSLRWTWISGPSLASANSPVATKGIFSSSNWPQGRCNSGVVVNAQSNIVYMFGGFGPTVTFNDMWAFKSDTREWAWISGLPGFSYSAPEYGVQGVTSPSNMPGARGAHAMVFDKASGLIITQGGNGLSSIGNFGLLSTLWAFNTTSYEWIWISGSSGMDNSANYTIGYEHPAAQEYPGMAIDPQSGDIFIYGGSGFVKPELEGNLDHMWRLSIAYGDSSSSIISHVSSRSSAKVEVTSFNSQFIPSANAHVSGIATTSSPLSAEWKRDANVSIPIFGAVNRTLLYLVFGGIISLTAFILVMSCAWYRAKARKSKATTTATGNKDSTVFSFSSTTDSFGTESSTYSTTGATTMVNTSMGIYLPGGLEVQATKSYRLEQEIARGGGGSVWLATAFVQSLTVFGSTVIVKTPNSGISNEHQLALFHQEVALLNAFKKQPNIVKMLGYSEDPHSIILKYYSRGSLTAWIKSSSRSMRQAHCFMKDISIGLLVLHSNGVVHCDLKPDNVLIEERVSTIGAVLSDFGIARVVSDKLLSVIAYHVQIIKGASLAYCAPEALREFRSNSTSTNAPHYIMSRDIYSMSIVMSDMLRGRSQWETTRDR